MPLAQLKYVVVSGVGLVALSLIPALSPRAQASVAASKGSKGATCKQLTKAQIQPLLSTPVAKVKITAPLQGAQQCEYLGSGAGDGKVIDVVVLSGSEAIAGFKSDVKGMSHPVAVPGVGDKAYRARGDFQFDSIKGKEYCGVSVGSEDSVTGVDALLINGSSDLPESANAIIASALGTICNRIYGKGNIKPSLSGLSSLATTTTSS